MIDVHFEDSSTKKFPCTPETTTAELLQKIHTKMHIKSDFESFALYDSFVCDGYQYDHILSKESILPKLEPDHNILFKKRHFFNSNWNDPDLVHMEYIQIREDVLRNRYVLDEKDWLELAAIDLRVTYGPPDATKHTAGFLSKPKLLGHYIPRAFLNQKSQDKWEKDLLEEYQRTAFLDISTEYEGKVEYLKKLKALCPDYYGSIFYEGSEIVDEIPKKDGKQKVIKKKYPSLLAININGIFMFRKDGAESSVVGEEGIAVQATKALNTFKNFISKATSSAPKVAGPTSPLDKYKHIPVRSNQFKEVIGWSAKPTTSTFVYSVPGTDSDHPIAYCFESLLFDEIPQACQEVVDIILHQMDAASRTEDKGEEGGVEGEGMMASSNEVVDGNMQGEGQTEDQQTGTE